MSIQRYQPSNTTLHDLYKLYNPFAYPYEYTDKMMNRLSTMIDRSVSRTLDSYFNEKAFDLALLDKGRYYEASADIAGIDPNNVKVSFANGLLTVSGEKKVDTVSEDGTTRTTRYEYVAKTVSVPDTDKAVMAKALNGRLTVTIPK
jgi:HSP20 family molecular chaperone IbpA